MSTPEDRTLLYMDTVRFQQETCTEQCFAMKCFLFMQHICKDQTYSMSFAKLHTIATNRSHADTILWKKRPSVSSTIMFFTVYMIAVYMLMPMMLDRRSWWKESLKMYACVVALTIQRRVKQKVTFWSNI